MKQYLLISALLSLGVCMHAMQHNNSKGHLNFQKQQKTHQRGKNHHQRKEQKQNRKVQNQQGQQPHVEVVATDAATNIALTSIMLNRLMNGQ